MQTVTFNQTPDVLHCPATGWRIVAPFDGNTEKEGTWDEPLISPHLLFIWDNVSGFYTHCADSVCERLDGILEEMGKESGDEDELEAFDRMISRWEAENDLALHFVFGEDGGLHFAFDLAAPVS